MHQEGTTEPNSLPQSMAFHQKLTSFHRVFIRIPEERSYANKIVCFFYWSQEVYYLTFYFTQAWRAWGFSEGHHSALYVPVVMAKFFQFSKYRNSIPYLEVCLAFICFSSLCRSYWLNHFQIGMVSILKEINF